MRCGSSRSSRYWLLVFAATYCVGIAATWLAAGPELRVSRGIFGGIEIANSSNVKITYAGWYDEVSVRPHAEFVIHNDSDEWLRYDAEYFTLVFVDSDTHTPVGNCGVDMKDGDIPPHTARRALLFPGGCAVFQKFPTSKEVSVAIPLIPKGKGSFQRFNSEPFYLPDEIKVDAEY